MINNTIFLIDEGYVKDNSSLMENVEANFFSEFILISQNFQIQEVIGTDLYKEIIDQFEDFQAALELDPNADITNYVEARLLTLVDDYIQVIVLYYTLYHSIYNLQLKYTNKGVEEQNSQYSSNANQSSIENQRAQWKMFAEQYIIEMVKFLEDNSTTYPEYETSDCDTRSSRTFGLYLGKSI